MLKSTIISLAVGVLVFFSVSAHQYSPQINDSERRSFVVIAAFNLHYNAKRYTEYIRQKDMNAEYAFNKQRQLYYVYALSSSLDSQAKDLVWKLRENQDFNDAWVFRGKLLEESNVPQLVKIDPPKTLLNVDNNISSNTDKPAESLDKPSLRDESLSKKEIQKSQTVNNTNAVTNATLIDEKKIREPVIKAQYKLYVNTINIRKFKEVRGSIEIRDNKRDKKLKTVSSHQLFGINDPKNGSHTVKVVSRIFGYRPIERIIDLSQPITDSTSAFVETIGDSIIVNLDLERLRKGEIAVMWNVYFFKDAAIMRPESKNELTNLLAMLKENGNLKIKIHGHTNGGSSGKLLHLNLDDKDFFSLSGNHIEDMGSAKKLSEYRGYTIQHYLMDQGIDESRMEVIGWGGKKMMYDKHDAQARKNVRVEVEVMDI